MASGYIRIGNDNTTKVTIIDEGTSENIICYKMHDPIFKTNDSNYITKKVILLDFDDVKVNGAPDIPGVKPTIHTFIAFEELIGGVTIVSYNVYVHSIYRDNNIYIAFEQGE